MSTQQDSYYYIFGLGKSGLATLSYLQKHSINILVWDDNPETRKTISEDLLQSPETLPWEKIEKIIVSPSIPHEGPKAHPLLLEAKKRSIPFTVDIELFLRQSTFCPHYHIIGITGTNGKSTTTSLLCHLLNHFGKKAVAAGNIGIPVLSLDPTTQETYFVLELSSYQLSLLETPVLEQAIFLNISPDHLDYHGSMDAYIRAKTSIFNLMIPDGNHKGILGIDDSYTQDIYKKNPDLLSISSESETGDIFIKDHKIFDKRYKETISLPSLMNLQGSHNAQNIVACYAALRQILGNDFSEDCFVKGLLSFKSLPHRQEIIAQERGIIFINDSKATNMNAAEKSLKVFKNIHWILGGKAKSGESPTSLTPYFKNVAHVYLVGSSTDAFEQDLKGLLPYTVCHTIDRATQEAYSQASPGDIILLAPACASFDQFQNFEERGKFFKTCTNNILKGVL